jgi:hypothetical protein
MLNRFHVWCLAAAFAAGGATGFAQNSDFKLDVHANSRATAEKIGLPIYPGATIYQDKDNSSADLGLVLNSFHFDLKAVNYITPDAPDKVLEFYRKPLSRYGEVLECLHGKAVGERTKTSSGLTCADEQGGHVDVNGSADSSKDRELRAGAPKKFRIVAIDNDAPGGRTRFGLVYLELPKDE